MSTDPLDFLDSSKSDNKTKVQSSDPLSFLDSDTSDTRSKLSAFPKGFIREARKMNPLQSGSPIPNKLAENILNKFLPTNEGPVEDILETAGEYAPSLITGEGGLIKKGLQSLAGGLAKKGAKEMELPSWMQEIVGVAGTSAPDALKSLSSKAIKAIPKQQQIVDFLKSKGLSDKEITPLIQNPKKLSWLSKAALKYEEKSPFLKGIQEKIGNVFQDVRTRGQTGNYLNGQELHKFENNFNNILDKIPKRHRRLVEKEIDELMQNPIDFTSLHDFNIAVNDIIKATQGGKASIGKLKSATRDAQKSLDPDLFKDLRMADEAYSKLMNFTDKMTKKNWDGLARLGDVGKTITGALIFDPVMMGLSIKGMAASAVGRYVLKQVLTNPRLQNIHKKLQEAVTKNNFTQASRLTELMKSEIQKQESSE